MKEALKEALINARMALDPDEYMRLLMESPDWSSALFADELDTIETLSMEHLFKVGPMVAMAGHSLGYPFKPALQKIEQVIKLQAKRIHDGHSLATRAKGGNWYRCNRDPESVDAMRVMLGHYEEEEFVFTHLGLSDILADVMTTFYDPGLEDWKSQKTSICFLGREFISDQKIIETTLKREINRARRYKAFQATPEPKVKDLMLGIQPNDDGIYDEQAIIDFVKRHASKIRILHLSHIVFSTGQRLDLHRIQAELADVIAEHQIIVGVDLAHTTGNRALDLPSLNIDYAAGCSYKFLSGTAGTGGFFYINNKVDQERYQPNQGWVAIKEVSEAFAGIDGQKPVEMSKKGAVAFTRSNPSPIAVAAAQEYSKAIKNIGWDKIEAKSECLTRYMIALLKQQLGNKVKFITPEDPKKRAATIVFQIHGLTDVKPIEALLKHLGNIDIDTRPPLNIRMTAHYGYINHLTINRVVSRLTEIVDQQLAEQSADNKGTRLSGAIGSTLFAPEPILKPQSGTLGMRAKL